MTRSCAWAHRRVSSGWPSVAGWAAASASRAACGKRQAQRGFGGRSGVGEPRERRRRAGQVAELLAGGQGHELAGLHQRGSVELAFSLAARRPSIRVQPAGQRRPALVRLAALQCGEPRLQRRKVRRLPLLQRGERASRAGRGRGCRRGAPPCGGGRCSRAVTRAVSGPRSGVCGGGRCSSGPRGLPARRAGAPGHRSARQRSAERRDAARPRSAPPPGSGSRRRSAREERCRRAGRRGRRSRAVRLPVPAAAVGRFAHRSSASIASWLGCAATRIRRQGSACNATAAGWPIASASTDRTASCSRAALQQADTLSRGLRREEQRGGQPAGCECVARRVRQVARPERRRRPPAGRRRSRAPADRRPAPAPGLGRRPAAAEPARPVATVAPPVSASALASPSALLTWAKPAARARAAVASPTANSGRWRWLAGSAAMALPLVARMACRRCRTAAMSRAMC